MYCIGSVHTPIDSAVHTLKLQLNNLGDTHDWVTIPELNELLLANNAMLNGWHSAVSSFASLPNCCIVICGGLVVKWSNVVVRCLKCLTPPL